MSNRLTMFSPALLFAMGLVASCGAHGATSNTPSSGTPSSAPEASAPSETGSSGGASGTSTTPPRPILGSCSALASAGTWENMTPPGVRNSQALALDPVHIGTLYIGASSMGITGNGAGGLFKSTDCGATWTHVNTGLKGPGLDSASIWSMAIDYVNPNVIYVVGAYGPLGLWKSTDGGVDWTQLFPSTSELAQVAGGGNAWVGSVSMDPHNNLHLAVGMHTNCSAPHNTNCGAETFDGGASWTIIDFPGTGWAEQTGPYVIDDSTLLYTFLFGGISVSTNHGASWQKLGPSGITGVSGGEYTHRPLSAASDGSYYLPAYQNGIVRGSNGDGGADGGDSWSWSVLPMSGMGYQLGFAMGGGYLYSGDRNGTTYQVAQLTNAPANPTWMPFPKPPQLVPINNTGEGPVYLDYDAQHHVLYSSNFEGGAWRVVTPW